MYGIMRVAKRKRQAVGGLEAEANRNRWYCKDFAGSEIDWSRTGENVFFVTSSDWWKDIKSEIASAGIEKTRKDAVVMLDAVYTASPEFFTDKSKTEVMEYFRDCLAFHGQEFGHVVNAVVHFDETTPHMHVCSVPITKDGRLSARDVMGNKQDYRNRQDRFHEQVGSKYGLERGRVRSPEYQRKHIEQMIWKSQQAEQKVPAVQLERLRKQVGRFLVSRGLVTAWKIYQQQQQEEERGDGR